MPLEISLSLSKMNNNKSREIIGSAIEQHRQTREYTDPDTKIFLTYLASAGAHLSPTDGSRGWITAKGLYNHLKQMSRRVESLEALELMLNNCPYVDKKESKGRIRYSLSTTGQSITDPRANRGPRFTPSRVVVGRDYREGKVPYAMKEA